MKVPEDRQGQPAIPEREFEDSFWRSDIRLDEPLDDLAGGIPDDAQFRLLADHIPTLCWIANGDGYIVWYNRRWHEYCGTTADEMEGWGWQKVHDPDRLPEVMERWTRSVETGQPFEMTFPLRGADGVYRPFLTRIQPVRDSSGAVKRWFGINTEIGARVEAEEALRASDERLRIVQAAGGIGAFDYDLKSETAVVSPEYHRILGIAPIETITLEMAKSLIHSDDLDSALAALDEAIEDRADLHIDYRIIRPDSGEIRWVRSSATLFVDEEGRPQRYVGGIRDVTEQKLSEEALRQSEERLRVATDAAAIGTWDFDPATGVLQWDERCKRLFGLSPDAHVDYDVFLAGLHPEDRDTTDKAVQQALDPAGPGGYDVEYRTIGLEDGVERWIAASGRAYFAEDLDGRRAARFVGTVIDISGHKAADTAIRRTEERYRLASRATNDAIWDWDLVANHVQWNEALHTIFGHDLDRIEQTGDWWLEQIHPDDRPRISDSIHAVIDGDGHRWEDEYRFRTADGGYRTVLDRGFVLRDEKGQAIRMIGAMLDQTERLQAQLELGEAGRRLETLNRTGSAIAAELDLERVVQVVTDAGVALTGAKFGAFFYNVTDANGEKLLLYSLSGADRAAFEKFGMPRATDVFKPTFVGEGTVRSGDITKDPRYGRNAPHKGMPKGHLPVVSYLAVSVTSRSGEVIGGLFFGHPEPDRFTEGHEELMVGIAAQAAVAIDNARLYQSAQTELHERMRAEAELRELNETLEQRVADEIEKRSVAEEALRQSQKMETLGQLTGGIAHDFNNLLQVVAGNLDILKRRLPEGDPRLLRSAENAMTGAMRAATLTQRLLAFSRRQPLEPKAIDINRRLAAMSELLHRTLGETIEVESVLAPRLWPVEADPNQLENAIINLAVNARDAMPGGGKLTIETQNTYLDRDYASRHPEVQPGQYAVICISDTGEGMSAETVTKAVEPFFTTKEVGKGTGLGLSMVYGFVKQSGGHLRIYSEVGEGTTVKIYLPRRIGEVEEEEERAAESAIVGAGNETILVCEDDDDVRAYSVEVLRELGYRVLEAHDGPSALRLLERQDGPVDLLFTDVVLPGGMSGAVLADKARAIRPDLKTLFTTGYARNAIVHHGRLDPGVELITKPFTYAALSDRVREILDAR